MKGILAKFSGVLELRVIRLVAASLAAYVVHNMADVVASVYAASPAQLTAVVFLAVYAGLRFPAQGLAALSIVPALFVVSFGMLARDMLYFVGERGFESAPAMMWSLFYGPYPGISYFMEDAYILGSGKSIGWIQAGFYLVVLSIADGVTSRRIEDYDLYMRVNMLAKAGLVECSAMGCAAVLLVETTQFGGLFSAAAFFAAFFVTLKIPAVSGATRAVAKAFKSFGSKARVAAAPKGASVTEALAQPPAPRGDGAVPPKKGKAKQEAAPVPSLRETLAARGKDAGAGIALATGESKRRALEVGLETEDADPEPEPEIDTSDDEILYRGAASMEEARQPVLMGFLAARIKPILGDSARIERLRQDKSLRFVIDSVAEYPDDLAGASDRYMAMLDAESGLDVTGHGREEGGDTAEVLSQGTPFVAEDDGFMDVGEALGSQSWSPPPAARAEPAAEGGWAPAESYSGEALPEDSSLESVGGFGGVVYGADHDPFEGILDSEEYVGEFGGMDAAEVAAAGSLGDASEDEPGEVALRPALAAQGEPAAAEAGWDAGGGAVDDGPDPFPGGLLGSERPGGPAEAFEVADFSVETEVLADTVATVPAAVAAPAEVEEMERPIAMVPVKRAPSDESLLARAVPMTEAEIAEVGNRKIRSMAGGSLSTFANGLVKILLEMRLGGHDEEDSVEWIQDRLPSAVSGAVDEARFLIGTVALASGYSEQDKRLARRRVAFVLTNPYRKQRLADVDATVRLIESGASVGASDVQDALRYVEGVCEIFPQLPDRESGSDRYAVARAVLAARAEEDRRKAPGGSALEIGAQRMRDVASGKGRAVLDTAPPRVKSLMTHLDMLRGFFEHLISKASFDSARDHSDMADHESREAADEVLALGQKAYADLESERAFVERVVRAGRPMTGEKELVSEFTKIMGPESHGFFETVSLEERVPARKRIGDLEARLAEAERRAGEGSGALRSVKIAFDLGMKDPVDAVLDRVAAEAGMSGEEMGATAFPIMRAVSLPGGVRLLTYSHTALKTRTCAFLPVYGMSMRWSASQGDGEDFVLTPENRGMPAVSLRAFAEANARALAEAGISDLKVLLMGGTLDSESSDASVRSLGQGDAWDGDNTAMRSTAIKGNVLVMEDLAVRYSEPAVKFGMAARAGFNRHFERIVS